MTTREDAEQVIRYADMFAAMGAEPRLRIMQLLLTAHPQGLVVGDIQEELGIPASTLSHHLDKLKNEELVNVRREGTFLWYTANTEALQELLNFLYAECCTRNKAVKPGDLVLIVQASKGSQQGRVKVREVPRRGTRSLAVGETYGQGAKTYSTPQGSNATPPVGFTHG